MSWRPEIRSGHHELPQNHSREVIKRRELITEAAPSESRFGSYKFGPQTVAALMTISSSFLQNRWNHPAPSSDSLFQRIPSTAKNTTQISPQNAGQYRSNDLHLRHRHCRSPSLCRRRRYREAPGLPGACLHECCIATGLGTQPIDDFLESVAGNESFVSVGIEQKDGSLDWS